MIIKKEKASVITKVCVFPKRGKVAERPRCQAAGTSGSGETASRYLATSTSGVCVQIVLKSELRGRCILRSRSASVAQHHSAVTHRGSDTYDARPTVISKLVYFDFHEFLRHNASFYHCGLSEAKLFGLMHCRSGLALCHMAAERRRVNEVRNIILGRL